MTFDQWQQDSAKYMVERDIIAWCKAAWEAGAAAEREECAKIAEKADAISGLRSALSIRLRGKE